MLNSEQIAAQLRASMARMAGNYASLGALRDAQDGAEPGVSPRRAIYREQKVTLYRYQPQASPTVRRPLLIVYALVNRPYMADLEQGRSLIAGLLQQGIDVYLVDWGCPDGSDRFVGMHDYVNAYLDHCVDVVRRRSGHDRLNLLGICQGGTFSLCYTALHPEKVANLITTVTPVDFQTDTDMLSHLVRHLDVEAAVDVYGNIPGDLLNLLFLSLKPFRLMSQKYVDLLDSPEDAARLENFMRMERWIFDSPDQAGRAFREFVVECYQKNALIKGTLHLGGQRVDLGAITQPVLNIFARDDHLVPPAASRALESCVGSQDYQEIEFPGGHIGLYVSGTSQRTLPPAIGDWLRARQ